MLLQNYEFGNNLKHLGLVKACLLGMPCVLPFFQFLHKEIHIKSEKKC